jgi:hypothetical protein
MTTWNQITTRSAGYKVTSSDYNTIAGSINHLGLADRCVLVTDSTNQTLTSGTWAAITFGAESYDGAGFHSTSTNTSRLTVPTGYGGIYNVLASITFEQVAATGLSVQVRKNGAASTAAALQASIPSFTSLTANHRPIVNLCGQLRLVAGDYLEVYALQVSGSNLAARGDTQAHQFGITWVAA